MAIITRGATITNTFNVSVDLTSAVVLYITFEQSNRVVLEKTLEDCAVTPESISVDFSQEDSIAFKEKKPVRIQIRARLADGSAHVSEIIDTTASELLKEGVI